MLALESRVFFKKKSNLHSKPVFNPKVCQVFFKIKVENNKKNSQKITDWELMEDLEKNNLNLNLNLKNLRKKLFTARQLCLC